MLKDTFLSALAVITVCPYRAASIRISGGTTMSAPVVGMMYEGWHGPAVAGLESPDNSLTVEDVLRSNGSYSMADMAKGINFSLSSNFYFHKQPLDGFYCIYRKRDNEIIGPIPDCANITGTLTRHARMLVGAGVDFIVADSTNFYMQGPSADVIQQRPFEVVLEEWLKLRKQGIKTPQATIWQNVQKSSANLWESFVDIYKNPAYSDLIYKDQATGKPVFFVTSDPDPGIVSKIEAEGFAVVVMWALRNNFANGEWAFFSPCLDATTGGFTTSISSDPQIKCNQHTTSNSSIGARGTAITVSPSYQLSYSALPYRASGKYGGLTLQRQFETAFSQRDNLDYLMVGTFNEHIAQPQHNPFNPPDTAAIAMGMENDAARSELWVDMYGDGITRDLEPTTADKGALWALFLSCMKVFKSPTAKCSDHPAEPCCDMQNSNASDVNPYATWVNIFSLYLPQDEDFLLTHDTRERASLLSHGWKEYCTPFGGALEFCAAPTSVPADRTVVQRVGGTLPAVFMNKTWGAVHNVQETPLDYSRSPFVTYAKALRPGDSVPLVRCITSGGQHFFARSEECMQLGKAESTLGYVSSHRSSTTPRSLRLCATAGAVGTRRYYHSLDAECADVMLDYLGFVH
eukprot:m.267281 g.267281  ORF g.267281 m.267281 type:complete len:631 (+) comp19731_c0_seq1:149-2041(+)